MGVRRETALATAVEETARRRAALGATRAEVHALEASREGWLAERRRERERAEEEDADAVVSARRRAAS
jgi:hypothetical protein